MDIPVSNKATIIRISDIKDVLTEYYNIKSCLKITLHLDVDYYIPGNILQLLNDTNHFFVVQTFPIKKGKSFEYEIIAAGENNKVDIEALIPKIKIGEYMHYIGTVYSQS
jgi:hypothetical protein